MQTLSTQETHEDIPHDECGVFGVWAPGEDVSKLAYFGLFALQHRGQEGAGIAVGDHEKIVVFKDTGLVSQVFDESILDALQGDVAVGHTRYSTTGGDSWENVQPMFRTSPNGTDVALAHNGNLTNYQDLQARAIERKLIPPQGVEGQGSSSDTAVVSALLTDAIRDDSSLLDAARTLLPTIEGAFCFMFTDGHTLYAARDPHGVRPLSLGRLERGWVIASETCALDIVGATYVRDVEPGELITIDETGVHTERFAETPKAHCVFEYVYLARPDSVIASRSVHASRIEIGKRLSHVDPVEGELVMPVPESGTPAAIGYAEESGIPFKQGLMKNAYVGRTFIQPSDTLRQLGLRLKLNPVREIIEGKRLIVVDDSIVRGNTQRKLIKMLREAGAAEVHVRIASPPVKWPCFYGIDFASPGELIANNGSGFDDEAARDSIRTMIGADSLAFVSTDDMIASTRQPADNLCTACFTGSYPLGLPEGNSNAELVRRMQKGEH
ncbi:amidophosphoribosyltransferase [Corynebacterium sanguinis]|uniref:Amidophosphoribosyltransferase n=1 Tax=Corynebacterium sanguinis TaxID=2594913 RepID=A0A6C1TYW8_9CORY|nr:amidophosphoribosyltransferase [Corynebacterium sanguinis]MBA4504033.1 amidophosphoribosyltransferase [Corynebacterium sanguinis]MCT1414384.1 amidophosphoribosyltransferase [Corynebacterium sanguinis]MCT1499274.1 amidophosphoribosyltransferase [Corynebacterium sanguinis]MCT1554870.1 amidophosphoribosyltransferase [Corynebacterium sanguinis]MCT1584948.1 amidophosphoribosyltransferase [Corynebacterium sanguinis]